MRLSIFCAGVASCVAFAPSLATAGPTPVPEPFGSARPAPSYSARPSGGRPEAIDLSFRNRVYLAPNPSTFVPGTSGEDPNHDPYVLENKVATVRPSAGSACDAQGCTFQLGLVVHRSIGGAPFKNYATISGSGSLVGNTVVWPSGATDAQIVLPVKLAYGDNKLLFTVDPYDACAETNENDNRFSTTLVLARR